MLLQVQEPDMIHNSGSDKYLPGLVFNESASTELFNLNLNGFDMLDLTSLTSEYLKDRDDLLEDLFFTDYGTDPEVLFRDVHWSSYHSEEEYAFLKQEKEDECLKSIVCYGSDGSITPVEDNHLAPTEEGSLTTTEDESLGPSEEESYRSQVIRPYTPNVDHSYHLVPTYADPGVIKCEEEERNVDIWNKTEELDQCSPAPVATRPSRKNLRRNRVAKTVSINKAANVALKRTKSQVAPKRSQKVKNSVETTPSSSDTEDMAKYSLLRDSVFNRRGAKSSAIQAINRCSSAKVERSSKRSDHNKMEKKRRQELRELYERLRDNIPTERFRGGSEKVRTNPSKQQILITSRKYLKHLTKEESNLKEQKRHQKHTRTLRRNVLNKLIEHFQKVFNERH